MNRRREQLLDDWQQMKNDAARWNRTHPDEEPIVIEPITQAEIDALTPRHVHTNDCYDLFAKPPKQPDCGYVEVDGQCYCVDCVRRTTDTYCLDAYCSNCSGKFTLKLRKGDKPALGQECPHCGVSYRVHTTGLSNAG